MTGQCRQCGAVLQAGTRFCGTCGAAASDTPGAGGSATAAWVVAVGAVGLLGAALTYILVSRDEASPADRESVAPAPEKSATAPAQPVGSSPMPSAQTRAPALAQAPPLVPAPVVTARVGDSVGNAGLIGSYRAWIGNADLYASDGVRLTRP